MDNQDWEPVIFSKRKNNKDINTKNNNVDLLFDNEMPTKTKKTEKREQISMMMSRVAHGYKTQKDLGFVEIH